MSIRRQRVGILVHHKSSRELDPWQNRGSGTCSVLHVQDISRYLVVKLLDSAGRQVSNEGSTLCWRGDFGSYSLD